MAGSFCATGTVMALPPGLTLASGATHCLVDGQGRPLFLLRSRALTLDALQGKVARVCGTRRGRVAGEPAPLLEVWDGVDVRRLPLWPGLDRAAPGACLETGAVPARLLLG